jgi:hypothetical protein
MSGFAFAAKTRLKTRPMCWNALSMQTFGCRQAYLKLLRKGGMKGLSMLLSTTLRKFIR